MNTEKKVILGLAAIAFALSAAAVAVIFLSGNPDLGGITAAAPVSGSSASTPSTGNIIDDFQRDFIKNDRYKYLVNGFINTVKITLLSLIMGLLLGIIVATVRTVHDLRGKLPILNAICKVYITVIRGTPVLVQLLIIYYVIFATANLNQILIAAAAFGINSGAYVAEIVRAGINAVPKGQLEAGESLGLPFLTTMTTIILPQAIKNILPALCNEGISLLKETSISGYIGILDLTKGGDLIRAQTYDALLPLLVVAGIYLCVVLVLTALVSKLERKLNHAY